MQLKKTWKTVAALVLLIVATYIPGTQPASAATIARDHVTIALAAETDIYNAVALYNPVDKTADLYGSETLTPEALPGSDPTEGVTPRKVDLADVSQGIYSISWHSGSIENKAVLVVSANPVDPTSPIAVIVPDYTWQAYSFTNGGGFYGDGVKHTDGRHFPYGISSEFPNGRHSYAEVNLHRALDNGSHFEMNKPWYNPIKFINDHLTNNDVFHSVDVIQQSILVSKKYDLSRYSEVIVYGHDEYWTPELFNKIKSAVAAGTSLFNMSGNTGYRRIAVTGSTIHFDTSDSSQSQLDAVAWGGLTLPVSMANDPSVWGVIKTRLKPTDFLGITYLYYPLAKEALPAVCNTLKIRQPDFKTDCVGKLEKWTGFRVRDASNRLFRGTDLKNGEAFGEKSKALAYEVDGIPFQNGKLVIRQNRPNSDGYGTSALADVASSLRGSAWGAEAGYKAGAIVQSHFGRGRVLSIGSIGWVNGILADDSVVRKITLNAIEDLLAAPIDQSSLAVLTQDVQKKANVYKIADLSFPTGMDLHKTITCYLADSTVQPCVGRVNASGKVTITSSNLKNITRVHVTLKFEPSSANYFIYSHFSISRDINI